MDSTDWANRFVPLPPTEFPPETTDRNHKEDLAISGGCVPETPMTQTDLPCLQAIAGVDPFFTPTDTPQALSPGPVSTATESSPLLSATESPISHRNNTPTSIVDRTSGEGLHSPSVEVIGQQAEQTPLTTENNLAAEAPLCEEKPESSLMKNPNQAKPIVEIHEYDLAMKVLSNTDASAAADSEGSPAEVVTNESESGEGPVSNDIASYWSQSNVSSFVPGVTPIEAYPVCREYEDHLSVTSGASCAAANDIEPEQESQSEQLGQQDVPAENVSDRSCEITPESVDATAEPLQVDPFENDEFESVYEVALTKSGQQNLQTAAVPSPPATVSEKIEPAQEDQPADSSTFGAVESTIHETASTATAGADVETPAEPVAEEISATPAEAFEFAPVFSVEPQAEPTAEVPELGSTPLDVTQEIPQWPSSNVMSTSMSSHQLFDSVEQSLSDLQSINQLEPENTFSPVVNALNDSPDQPRSETATPIANPEHVVAPGPAVEPVHVEDPVWDATSAATEPSASVEQVAETQQSAIAEQSVFVEPPAITEPTAVESPASAQEAPDLVAIALASIAPPAQRAPAFEAVDLTAQLPVVPTDAFSAPPTASGSPSMPTEAADQSPVEFAPATEPVELQTPTETPVLPSEPAPVQQNTPSFEPVDLTAQLPASVSPSMPTEAADQSPVEFAPATEPVELQTPTETPVLPSEPAPVQQNTPSFEPVDLTAQLPASVSPSMPTEAADQSPVEFASVTEPVELQTPAETPVTPSEPAPAEAPVATAPEPKGQVIEVDGNDGYDFLDLKAFDVANAIFTPGIIFLDDGKNRFQIEYRNLKHAVFADDFQVELN